MRGVICPLGGCGGMLPQETSCSEVASGALKKLKITYQYLNIKKKCEVESVSQ